MDLEASCWEIGAVRLDDALEVTDEFCSFIRPVVVPRL